MRYKTPAYSQYLEVEDADWQDRSCGIISLKMLLDYWLAGEGIRPVDADALIEDALNMDGYIPDVGWRHRTLLDVARHYDLEGEHFDWNEEHPDVAFNRLVAHLGEHPVMASIYKDLREGESGHLVILTGYEDGTVFYNDPDSDDRRDIQRSAPLAEFLDGWKRRIVVVHPGDCACSV